MPEVTIEMVKEIIKLALETILSLVMGSIYTAIKNRKKKIHISEYNYNLSRKVLLIDYFPLIVSAISAFFLLIMEIHEVNLLKQTWIIGNVVCVILGIKLVRYLKYNSLELNTIIILVLYNLFNMVLIIKPEKKEENVLNCIIYISILCGCWLNIEKEKVRDISYIVYCKEGSVYATEDPDIESEYVLIHTKTEKGRNVIKLNKDEFIKSECQIVDIKKEEKEDENKKMKDSLIRVWNRMLSEKLNLVNGIAIVGVLLLYRGVIQDIFARGLHLQALGVGIALILMFAAYKWIKAKVISLANFVGIICLEIMYLITNDKALYSANILIVGSILFLVLIIVALYLTWNGFRAKQKCVLTILICLSMIYITFASLYSSLYSMYSPRGMECFKIEQGMSWEQVLLAEDFLYYSGDMMFGTSLSDVSINYIDYYEFQEGNPELEYLEQADIIIHVAKVFSMFETIVFIVYIGIIIIQSKEREESRNEIQVQII